MVHVAVDEAIRLYARSEAATGRAWEGLAAELGVEMWRMKGLIGVTKRMSDKEAKVCALVMDGMSLEQVASRMGVHYNTVSSHAGNARRKGYDIPKRQGHRPAGRRKNGATAHIGTLSAWAMLLAGCEYSEIRRVLGYGRNQMSGAAFRLRLEHRLSDAREERWAGIVGSGRVCPIAVMAAALPFA